jgi:hypothetical protein
MHIEVFLRRRHRYCARPVSNETKMVSPRSIRRRVGGLTAKSAAQRTALALLLLSAPPLVPTAAACTCDINPPCAAIWQAEAVFVGTVVDRASEVVGGSLSWTVHRIAVSRTFRGSVDSSVTLVPALRPSAEAIAQSLSYPGGLETISTCDYRFEPGREYLIYAHRTDQGRWTTSLCSGTKPLEEAAEDLEYIESVPLAEPTGRVYGTIERTIPDPADRTTMNVPAAGIPVALVSEHRQLTVTTDVDGKFDLHVPPGNYTVAPVLPQTVRVYGGPRRVSVPSRGCAPVSFWLVANGRIEGRVVERDGKPVPRVSIDVIPADLPAGQRPESHTTAPSGRTDERGRFAVEPILPGRYVVAVNARSGPQLSAPYAATFYPGVNRTDARAIELGDSERQTGLTIVVTPLEETTVSGMVTFDDDRPVVDANVTAAPVDHKGTITSSATTDNSGAFQLRLLAGITYVIRAGTSTTNAFKQTETVFFVGREQETVRLTIRR